jgi:hypothetical protein
MILAGKIHHIQFHTVEDADCITELLRTELLNPQIATPRCVSTNPYEAYRRYPLQGLGLEEQRSVYSGTENVLGEDFSITI